MLFCYTQFLIYLTSRSLLIKRSKYPYLRKWLQWKKCCPFLKKTQLFNSQSSSELHSNKFPIASNIIQWDRSFVPKVVHTWRQRHVFQIFIIFMSKSWFCLLKIQSFVKHYERTFSLFCQCFSRSFPLCRLVENIQKCRLSKLWE